MFHEPNILNPFDAIHETYYLKTPLPCPSEYISYLWPINRNICRPLQRLHANYIHLLNNGNYNFSWKYINNISNLIFLKKFSTERAKLFGLQNQIHNIPIQTPQVDKDNRE